VSRSNGKAKENKISAPAATITNSEKTATESIVLEEPKGIEESRSNGKAKQNISAPTATITNSEKTETESSKPEGAQSIGPSPRSMIGEDHFGGEKATVLFLDFISNINICRRMCNLVL
jgi:translation initiation factor 4A